MAWYDVERPGLGRELLDEMHDVAQHAAQFPQTGTVIKGLPLPQEFRRFLLKRFPYEFIARVEHSHLVVFVVTHQHRRPRHWAHRLLKLR
ncbi:MAG TPA: hypothetical protein VF331_23150 [Polyangiales bacterium]